MPNRHVAWVWRNKSVASMRWMISLMFSLSSTVFTWAPRTGPFPSTDVEPGTERSTAKKIDTDVLLRFIGG